MTGHSDEIRALTWEELQADDFPSSGTEKVRYADLDVLGHVNNIAFMTYLESGRVGLLFNDEMKALTPGATFVLVQKNTAFRREMHWPGNVDVGTGILKIGGSSLTMIQALFQNGVCSASSEAVLVLIDDKTRESTPIPEEARRFIEKGLVKFEIVK